MWRYQNTDELYHHGIPGMRWGVRKAIYRLKSNHYKRKIDREKAKKQYLKRKAEYINLKNYNEVSKKVNKVNKKNKTVDYNKIEKKGKDYINNSNINNKNLNNINNATTSKGKKAMNYIANNIVIPAATQGTRNALSKKIESIADTVLNNKNDKNDKKK